MKKVFAITLIMLFHFVFSANAQPGLNIAQQHRAYIDSLLATVGIGKQTIPTGILYDRAIAIASLQKHDHSKRVNKNMFMQAALEIRNAAYDTLQHPSNSAIRSIAEHYTYRRNIAPIGVSFNRMTYIDTLAVEKGLIIIDGQGRPRPTGRLKTEGLQQMDMLMAAILWDGNELEMQQSFILPTELIMGNRKAEFETVEIDFDDGQGFRSVTFNTPVDVSYSTHGSKTMVLKATTSEGEEFSSFSTFDVKDSTPIVWSAYGIIEEIHRQDTIYADISFAGSNGNFQGMGLVTYLHRHADKKLRKPVLIVDGFDPGNNNKDDNIFFTYLNNEDTGFLFADSLHAAGYDLVILDFPKAWNELVYNPPYPCYVPGYGWDTCGDTWGKTIDAGADYIQRNAYLAVKVIETLNQQLQENGSNEELVVIGPSMGGLITRYALRYMELQPSLNHNTRLWVSFDSPHKGANIPIGLQHYIDYFAQAEINDAVVARKLFLQNPAAKQMLIHHYLSNSETPVGAPGYHTNWYNEINSMGFPQQLRRVAISNGSINGTNEATPGSKALEW